MAYDLFHKTQIPLNCSRNPDAGPALNKPTATLAAAGLVIVVRGLFGKIQRDEEKRRYQRELRPGHYATVEAPTVPMREIMRFKRDGYQT